MIICMVESGGRTQKSIHSTNQSFGSNSDNNGVYVTNPTLIALLTLSCMLTPSHYLSWTVPGAKNQCRAHNARSCKKLLPVSCQEHFNYSQKHWIYTPNLFLSSPSYIKFFCSSIIKVANATYFILPVTLASSAYSAPSHASIGTELMGTECSSWNDPLGHCSLLSKSHFYWKPWEKKSKKPNNKISR